MSVECNFQIRSLRTSLGLSKLCYECGISCFVNFFSNYYFNQSADRDWLNLATLFRSSLHSAEIFDKRNNPKIRIPQKLY